jgi:hypothetical protein
MPRIAKADVNAALSTVAKAIVDAGGSDGRTSRAEMKAALTTLPKEQRALADVFFRFVDHRDFKAGAQVTPSDVKKAVSYAKEHMIANYDLDSNGLSKTEIAKMSLTGKLAVGLAKALKGAGGTGATTLDSKKLGAEINKVAAKALYMSESDYAAQYVSGRLPAGGVTGANAMTALSAPLKKLFAGSGAFPADYAAQAYKPADAKAFIDGLAKDNAEGPEASAAFGTINGLLKNNLTDVQVFNVGPRDVDGRVASDQGLYGRLVVGKTSDGKLAGVLIGAVET